MATDGDGPVEGGPGGEDELTRAGEAGPGGGDPGGEHPAGEDEPAKVGEAGSGGEDPAGSVGVNPGGDAPVPCAAWM